MPRRVVSDTWVSSPTSTVKGDIRVGPAGWSYADWEGAVYPRQKPHGFHPLAYLSQFLDCIELNSSFYAHPSAQHARRWRELVHDDPSFHFLAKLNRVFTHEPLPDEAGFDLERVRFLEGLAPLGDRLTALLVQFPLSFGDSPEARRRLDRIREGFGERALVLEVRHRSWFEPEPLAWIEDRGFSLAAIDLPAGADHPPEEAPTLGPIGYLRLHGRNAAAWFDRTAGRDQRYDYLYDQDEVSGLADRARRIAGGSDRTYVVTNNHFSGKAVANALDIVHALTGADPWAPPTLVERFPHLAGITRVRGQASLF